MSYFGDQLSALMETNKVNGMDIQRATGINNSQISRWIGGQQFYVSKEDMGHLCRTAAKSAHQRASLIAAYLRDNCTGPGSELISIQLTKAPAKAAPASATDRLFAFLRQLATEKPPVKKILLTIARNEGFK